MTWAAFVLKTGFFGTRRMVQFIATVFIEMIPIGGVIPAWTLFVVLQWFMQSAREHVVKAVAKVSPQKAEKAAMRLQAAQRTAERGASKMGKEAQTSLKEAPSLAGSSGEMRRKALEARYKVAQDLAPRARQEILTPLRQEVDRVMPDYNSVLEKKPADSQNPAMEKEVARTERRREIRKQEDIDRYTEERMAA